MVFGLIAEGVSRVTTGKGLGEHAANLAKGLFNAPGGAPSRVFPFGLGQGQFTSPHVFGAAGAGLASNFGKFVSPHNVGAAGGTQTGIKLPISSRFSRPGDIPGQGVPGGGGPISQQQIDASREARGLAPLGFGPPGEGQFHDVGRITDDPIGGFGNGSAFSTPFGSFSGQNFQLGGRVEDILGARTAEANRIAEFFENQARELDRHPLEQARLKQTQLSRQRLNEREARALDEIRGEFASRSIFGSLAENAAASARQPFTNEREALGIAEDIIIKESRDIEFERKTKLFAQASEVRLTAAQENIDTLFQGSQQGVELFGLIKTLEEDILKTKLTLASKERIAEQAQSQQQSQFEDEQTAGLFGGIGELLFKDVTGSVFEGIFKKGGIFG